MKRRRRRIRFQTVCVSLLLVAIAGGAGPASADEVARRVFVMGTWLDVSVTAADRSTAIAAAEASLRAVEATERRLSSWRADSEVSALNHAPPGSWVALSFEFASDLEEAFGWARRTNGWFNPGVASLVRAWDLRGSGRVPSDAELDEALAGARAGAFELRGSTARRLAAVSGIEEGGFGKGIALRDAAAAALERHADCVRLNFGGQTHAAGTCPPIHVGIAGPRDRSATVARLQLTSGSVATSGNAERGIVVEGVRFGHLLDPHSGRPTPDFGSVTVLSADPVAADCLSTALYAMGPNRGATWLEAQEGVEVVYVVTRDEGVDVLVSPSLLDRISVEDPRVTLRALAPVDRRTTGAHQSGRGPAGSWHG